MFIFLYGNKVASLFVFTALSTVIIVSTSSKSESNEKTKLSPISENDQFNIPRGPEPVVDPQDKRIEINKKPKPKRNKSTLEQEFNKECIAKKETESWNIQEPIYLDDQSPTTLMEWPKIMIKNLINQQAEDNKSSYLSFINEKDIENIRPLPFFSIIFNAIEKLKKKDNFKYKEAERAILQLVNKFIKIKDFQNNIILILFHAKILFLIIQYQNTSDINILFQIAYITKLTISDILVLIKIILYSQDLEKDLESFLGTKNSNMQYNSIFFIIQKEREINNTFLTPASSIALFDEKIRSFHEKEVKQVLYFEDHPNIQLAPLNAINIEQLNSESIFKFSGIDALTQKPITLPVRGLLSVLQALNYGHPVDLSNLSIEKNDSKVSDYFLEINNVKISISTKDKSVIGMKFEQGDIIFDVKNSDSSKLPSILESMYKTE